MTIRTLVVSTIAMLGVVPVAEAQGTHEQGLFRITERVVTPERPAAEAHLVDEEVRRRINALGIARERELKRDPGRVYAGLNVSSATNDPRDLVQVGRRRVQGAVRRPRSRFARQRLWLAKRVKGVQGLEAWAERVIAKTHVYETTAQGRAEIHSLFVSSSEPEVTKTPGRLEDGPRVERVADQVALVIQHHDDTGHVVDSIPIHLSLDELGALASDPDAAARMELGALIRSLHRQTEPAGASPKTSISTIAIHAVHGTQVGRVVGFLPVALLDRERKLSELPFGRTGTLLEERRLARAVAAQAREQPGPLSKARKGVAAALESATE